MRRPARGATRSTTPPPTCRRSPPAAVVHDTLVVNTLDGSDTETINVTITGSADAATISGTTTGAVTEDGTLTAGGTLSVADVDSAENHFQIPASLAGTYGSFTFNAQTGAWGYTLDNGQSNVQALAAGQIVHDFLAVNTLDGSDTETINVTITGINDPARSIRGLEWVCHRSRRDQQRRHPNRNGRLNER